MKYIIMEAQEARESEDLGGLTITKQFKTVPPYIEGASLEQTDGGNWRLVDGTGRPIEGKDGAENIFVPPVQSGDIVYIREPWIRLKNPDGSPSDRVRLAADSVVPEGQQTCKWSSPVSVPGDAARRFAVAGAVEPIYNKNIIIWQIMLYTITKETAQETEAPDLPVPAAKIDADCERLTTEADQKTRVLEDLDGEDEILAADELEISAYLGAAVTMAEGEPTEDSAELPDGEDGTGLQVRESECGPPYAGADSGCAGACEPPFR